MAEDIAPSTCRRGHPRTPETLYVESHDGYLRCRLCKRESVRRFAATSKGKASHRAAYAKYNNSTKGLVRSVRGQLVRLQEGRR